jgi:quercetin dioxygenase-like cupin family protein
VIRKSIDVISDPVSGQTIVFRARTARRVAAELFVRPGGFVPAHVHASQWERFEGVSGELRFRLGRRRQTLRAGDVIEIPPRMSHGLRNVGSDVAHFLIELSPPRRGEEGLRTLFGLQQDGRIRVTRFTARPLLQVAVLFDEYLDEVHLPLLPVRVQRLAFGALARLGTWRGYGAAFPEYEVPVLSDLTPRSACSPSSHRSTRRPNPSRSSGTPRRRSA